MDTTDDRLAFCKETLGFEHTINALGNVEEALLEITGGLYASRAAYRKDFEDFIEGF